MNPLEISDEVFEALTEQRRTEQFLAASRWSEVWARRAMLHKRAADMIYETGFRAWERDIARIEARHRDRIPGHTQSWEVQGQEREDLEDQLMLGEYFILIGYGFECLLKGYLLAIIPDLVIERLDALVAIHSIPQLCHECGIELTPEEAQLAGLITRNVVWGKYTAPLRRKDMPSWIEPEDQDDKSLAASNPFANRRVQVLVDGILAQASQLLESQFGRNRST